MLRKERGRGKRIGEKNRGKYCFVVSYLVLMNLKENSLKPIFKQDNVSVLSPQYVYYL